MVLVGKLNVNEDKYLSLLIDYISTEFINRGPCFSNLSTMAANRINPSPPCQDLSPPNEHRKSGKKSLQFNHLSMSVCNTILHTFQRIPPQWVELYGRDLPPQCFLVMPHGGKWVVQLLNVENGCYFRSGWSSFANVNNVNNGDILFFTRSGDDVFHVVPTTNLCINWLPSII